MLSGSAHIPSATPAGLLREWSKHIAHYCLNEIIVVELFRIIRTEQKRPREQRHDQSAIHIQLR